MAIVPIEVTAIFNMGEERQCDDGYILHINTSQIVYVRAKGTDTTWLHLTNYKSYLTPYPIDKIVQDLNNVGI